jgi:hypothetical protein
MAENQGRGDRAARPKLTRAEGKTTTWEFERGYSSRATPPSTIRIRTTALSTAAPAWVTT